ncbi:DUF6621 family protein [uncultured Bacteroides sp.]|uniref:DUF6621 family protein n=1 Tax=uncultured Bacteroides sp. TaxID=162156 RepID=UPI002AAA6BBB|nr:DUF6621 family protein [uncultured Bacteroides sp.]
MAEKIQLAETVMLMDAAYLNLVIADLKKNFERILGRSLHDIDLAQLITYLALDSSISQGKNEIQVLWVYDEKSSTLVHCNPSDLKEELNGVAFTNQFGEFSFAGVPAEHLVSCKELYLDLLTIVADSSDVKKIIIVSHDETSDASLEKEIGKIKDKEIIYFRMNEPQSEASYRWELLAYPVMQALGIRGDELS